MVGHCGLIHEQVWDAAPIPERALAPGKPSGSAMPLVWAHAEFVELVYSMALERPFDRPEAAWQRYHGVRPTPEAAIWTPALPIAQIAIGQTLYLLLPRPACVHHGVSDRQRVGDVDTVDTGLSLHAARLPTSELTGSSWIDFTLLWSVEARWEGTEPPRRRAVKPWSPRRAAASHPTRIRNIRKPTMSKIAVIIGADLLDRYLASAGYEGQLSKQPQRADAPANLFEPVPGHATAHGRFDNVARTWSPEMFADRRREVLFAAATVGLLALGSLVCSGRK